VVVGAVVLLVGFAARELENVYGGTTPGEFVEQADGTASIYDLLETAGDGHEIQEIDESVSAVYAFAADTGAPVEVFRGTHHEAQAWMVVADAGTRVLVFEGNRAEALAWDQARTDAGKKMLVPNSIIVVGGALVVVGSVVGWRRRHELSD